MSFHRPCRTRRLLSILGALPLLAMLSACSARPDKTLDAGPIQQPASAEIPNPMASFARLVSGEWRVTAQSGTSMFHTWHWGPGRHSVRRMTDGTDAGGSPWRELRVAYWHPGLKQVRLMGLTPFRGGVMEGSIQFEGPEGDTADAVFDLYQIGDLRKMGQRWDFDGPDKYHEVLLEATGSAGFKALVEWDHVRSRTPATRPSTAEEAPRPAGRPKALEALVDRTWEAKGAWAAGDAFHIQSTVEWIPYANGIYMRVQAPGQSGEPGHLLDAYVYHHTGTDKLRGLVLTKQGGVYEGDASVVDGGALELDLKGYEGEQVVSRAVRLDFEQDGTLRQRAWSIEGSERRLILDIHHKVTAPRRS